MSEYVYGTDEHEGHWLTGEMIVRCRDCREVRHELPTRVGNYEQPERWVCRWWAKCETLPDAFCSWGKGRCEVDERDVSKATDKEVGS